MGDDNRNPRDFVWFLRAKDGGKLVWEGTAVAVRLRKASTAVPPVNYLLTCAHVVRDKGTTVHTLGQLCDKLRAWPPGSGFNPEHGLPVSPVANVRPLDPDSGESFYQQAVADVEGADWVLLKFESQGTATYQQLPTAQVWIDKDPDENQECTIYGYARGADGFQGQDKARTDIVRPSLPSIQVVRCAGNGVIEFQGSESRPGMSGGGVFCKNGDSFVLAGLHRERDDSSRQLLAVSAAQIRKVLESYGYEIVRVSESGVKSRREQTYYEPMGGYTLLTSHAKLVGRTDELAQLDAWPKGRGEFADARIVCLVALGGMGKSALTWHWYKDRAEAAFPLGLSGKMWWSFYDQGATFSNFLSHALSYTEGTPLQAIQALPDAQKETQLFAALEASDYLLVLDGMERVLIAYAGYNASYVQDATVTKAEQEHLPRQTTELRAGRFLRRLADLGSSRILISSRLFPAALETSTGKAILGVRHHELGGLADEDALVLWENYGSHGTKEALLRLFHSVGSHPLVLQTLAATIHDDPDTPGDFDAWQQRHPDFTPYTLDLLQARSHVILAVLHQLAEGPLKLKVLRAVAAFRGPAKFEHLADMLVGSGEGKLASEEELYRTLTDLGDRGLVGRDDASGTSRWDLHPLVRGVAWENAEATDREATLREMESHFRAYPLPRPDNIRSLEDLAEAQELFFAMTRLGLKSEAQDLLKNRLFPPLQKLPDGPRALVEMLDALYPVGAKPDGLVLDHKYANDLSDTFRACGRLGRAVEFFRPHAETCALDLCSLKSARLLLDSGQIKASAETMIRLLCKATSTEPHFVSATMSMLAALADVTGDVDLTRISERVALRFMNLATEWQWDMGDTQLVSFDFTDELRLFPYQCAVRHDAFWAARAQADQLWSRARVAEQTYSLADAACCQGAALAAERRYSDAEERFNKSLEYSHRLDSCGLIAEAALGLGRVALATIDSETASEGAREWSRVGIDHAQRGQYRLIEAEGWNLLAEAELGDKPAASSIAAANNALDRAWCDGQPFCDKAAVDRALNLLRRAGKADAAPPRPVAGAGSFELDTYRHIKARISLCGRDVSVTQLRRVPWTSLARLLIIVGLSDFAARRRHGGVRQELEILATDAWEIVRDAAASGLAAAQRHDNRFEDDRSKLSSPDPGIRRQAVERLSSRGEAAGAAVGDMAALLNDLDPMVREGAAKALGRLGPVAGPHIGGLAVLLKDTDSAVRRAAARALGALRSAAGPHADGLAALLTDTDAGVREASAVALGGLGVAAGPHANGLAALLKDPDPAVRRAAAWALEGLGSAAGPHAGNLAALLNDTDAAVRRAAAVALAGLGGSAGPHAGSLAALLKDPDPAVRRAAVEALARLGEAAGAVAGDVAALLKDSDPAVRAAAAAVLGWIGVAAGPDAVGLVALLKDSDPAVRQEASGAIARLGEAAGAVAGDVAALLKDPDPGIRREAARALGWLGAAARPYLGHLADLLEDQETLDVVIGSMIRLGDTSLIKSTKVGIRLGALDALATRVDVAKSIIPDLLACFDDPVVNVQLSAIAVVGALGESVVDHLGRLDQALRSDKPAVRRSALWAIRDLGPRADDLASYIIDSLDDADANVRLAAVQAFAPFANVLREDVSKLAKCTRDPTASIREAAVRSSSQIAPASPLTQSSLVLALLDGDRKVRDAARGELASLLESGAINDDGLSVLIAAFDEERSDPDLQGEGVLVQLASREEIGYRQAAIRALGRRGAALPETVHKLAGWLHDVDAGVREESARALGMLGAPAEAAISELVHAVADPEPAVAIASVEALVLIKPSEFPHLGSAYSRREQDQSDRRPIDLARDDRVVKDETKFSGSLEPRNDFDSPIWRDRDGQETVVDSSGVSARPVTRSDSPGRAPAAGPPIELSSTGTSVTWTISLHIPISIGASEQSAASVVAPAVLRVAPIEGRFGRRPPARDPYATFAADSLLATRFDWRTSLSLALASRLSYEHEDAVRNTALGSFRLQTCEFIEADDIQCFVASSADAFLVAFRGTAQLVDRLANLNALSTTRDYGQVHRGFLSAFQVVDQPLRSALSGIAGRPLLLTGHGLGGALATIAAAEWQGEYPITGIYTYGQPAVGKGGFPAFIQRHYAGKFVRFVNDNDIVPRVPPTYHHVGTLYHFNAAGNLTNRKESFSGEGFPTPSSGSPESIESPPMLTQAEFDRLRAQLLEQRVREREAGVESVEAPLLEGIVPGVADHSLDRYIARIIAKVDGE